MPTGMEPCTCRICRTKPTYTGGGTRTHWPEVELLEWTKEKPTVIYGYYYVWDKQANFADVVLVASGTYYQVGFGEPRDIQDWDVWWYGPIQPPTLPPQEVDN